MNGENTLRLVAREFKRLGIILESDQKLPNIATLVAGERVKGSWWSHPKGRMIWQVLNRFSARHDVLITKLVSGKITFIHRRLWPDFLALSTSKEDWQTATLPPRALALLKSVEENGKLRTDNARAKAHGAKLIADAARELERRLLVHSEEIHTTRGFHAKVLRSWRRWSRDANFTKSLPSVAAAKAKFEMLLRTLNEEYGADGRLPWAD